jgi:nucleoside-diphosphate-sugar epimerase
VTHHPPAPKTEDELEDYLSTPTPGTIHQMAELSGDLLVIGAGGKMGFSLSRMARRSLDATAQDRRVLAVSRFTEPGGERRFQAAGIDTLRGDVMDQAFLDKLPDSPKVLHLVGVKFGTSASPAYTWASNVFLSGMVARRFRNSRMVVLSSGNVYPLSSVHSDGPAETDPLEPVGEYAQSCLGRERIFEYFSQSESTPMALIRLNYANALRYGVLTDIAQRVVAARTVDVTTGYVNVIWQADANAAILRAFGLCASPPAILNVAGPEKASVRALATRLASLMGKDPPAFTGCEASTALLSNASRQRELFGYPSVGLETLLAWTAEWVAEGKPVWGKPTHFQVREGQF